MHGFLQFSLPATWTHGSARGMSIEQMSNWWSAAPAKLANLPRKVPLASAISDSDYYFTFG